MAVMMGVLLVGALTASTVLADDGQRRRGPSDRGGRAEQRAVPRSRSNDRPTDAPRNGQVQRQVEPQRRFEPQRQYDARPQPDARPRYDARPQYDARRGYDVRRDTRPYYPSRPYSSRPIIVPRIVRPTIVTVVPYRPYVYRPRLSIGVYYGAGGAYPYGYTPRGYYDPIPGRLYGGVRITGAPRYAQVFADGYYVGIVDDFDGIFQHVNLEAGPHRIEIEEPGYPPIAFDVMVQPGRTVTFRADMYRY